MKRLMALLLVTPALASANGQSCPWKACIDLGFATSGSATYTDSGVGWDVSGAGFSSEGSFGIQVSSIGPKNPFIPPGGPDLSVADSGGNPTFRMDVTFGGVTYGNVAPGGSDPSSYDTAVSFLPPPLPGGSSSNFDAVLLGLPEALLNTQNPPTSCYGAGGAPLCTLFEFQGNGNVLVDVQSDEGYHNCQGCLYVASVSLTFTTPEPSTASLLVFGFAGLVVLGRRRRSLT